MDTKRPRLIFFFFDCSMSMDLFFKLSNFIFVLISFCFEHLFVVCHFFHEVFFFFGEVQFKTVVHIVIVCLCLREAFFTFD